MQFFFFLFFLGSSALSAPEVAITIDNFDLADAPLLKWEDRDERILAALKDHGLSAAAFVTTKNLADPRVAASLKKWDAAGHLIGNHTHSHKNYNQTDFAAYSRDILKADALLSGYKNFSRILRLPYLSLGKTAAAHGKLENFLKDKGYRLGDASIRTYDLFIDKRLVERLRKNPAQDLAPYREYFLKNIWERSLFYDSLSTKLLPERPRHVLVLHHNLLTALFLKDLIQMYKDRGWKVISAASAFQDPLYAKSIWVKPVDGLSGEGVIASLAMQSGKFTSELAGSRGVAHKERPEMDRLGL